MPASKYKQFIDALKKIANRETVPEVSRYFWPDPNAHSSDNKILGVSIGKIFPIAKQFVEMSLQDVERLLDNPHYEVRMARSASWTSRRATKRSRPKSERPS